MRCWKFGKIQQRKVSNDDETWGGIVRVRGGKEQEGDSTPPPPTDAQSCRISLLTNSADAQQFAPSGGRFGRQHEKNYK